MPSGSRASATAPVLRAMWRRQWFSVARNASSTTQSSASSVLPAFCAPISRPSSARKPRSTLLSVLIVSGAAWQSFRARLVERDRRAVFQLQLDFADGDDRASVGERADFAAVERKLDVLARLRLQRARRAPDLGFDEGLDPAAVHDGLQLRSRLAVGNDLQIGRGRADLGLVFAAVGGERAGALILHGLHILAAELANPEREARFGEFEIRRVVVDAGQLACRGRSGGKAARLRLFEASEILGTDGKAEFDFARHDVGTGRGLEMIAGIPGGINRAHVTH